MSKILLNVKAGSVAIIPDQWGGKSTIRPHIGNISGSIIGDDNSIVGSFNEITDVIGGAPPKGYEEMNVRDALKKINPGLLIIELPSAENDLGTKKVILNLPDACSCPEGTIKLPSEGMGDLKVRDRY